MGQNVHKKPEKVKDRVSVLSLPSVSVSVVGAGVVFHFSFARARQMLYSSAGTHYSTTVQPLGDKRGKTEAKETEQRT